MSSGQGLTGDTAHERAKSNQMLTGWKHLQRSLGGSFAGSVKRSRKLAAAQLRRKG